VGREVDHGIVPSHGTSQAGDVEQIGLDGRGAELAQEIAIVSGS
jgi:hypothetical protein